MAEAWETLSYSNLPHLAVKKQRLELMGKFPINVLVHFFGYY